PDSQRWRKLRLAALLLPERRGAHMLGLRRVDVNRDHTGRPRSTSDEGQDQKQPSRAAHHAARRWPPAICSLCSPSRWTPPLPTFFSAIGNISSSSSSA